MTAEWGGNPRERQLPPSDRSEPAEGAGPRPGEGFSETLERLARERHPDLMAKADTLRRARVPGFGRAGERVPGEEG